VCWWHMEGGKVLANPRVPPPPRTKWTRRVPHPVLIGHAASGGATYRVRGAGAAHAPATSRGLRVALITLCFVLCCLFCSPSPGAGSGRARRHRDRVRR